MKFFKEVTGVNRVTTDFTRDSSDTKSMNKKYK